MEPAPNTTPGGLRRCRDEQGPRRQDPGRRRPEAITQTISAETPGAAEDVAEALRSGGVVVIPTDTVYGIAACLDRPGAVERIFRIKRRPHDKPLAVLVASYEKALELGRFSQQAEQAAKGGWPGALTVVVPSARPLPQIGGDGSTVGLRVPDHRFALDVIERAGPLAATSANLSGSPPAATVGELRESMREEVDLYVDGGTLASAPSKVVSFAGAEQVLRQ